MKNTKTNQPDDTQIPQPDLRFATKQNRTGPDPTKHPQTSKTSIDLPSDRWICATVSSNMHYRLKFFIQGLANRVKRSLKFATHERQIAILQICTQRKHTLRFLSHVLSKHPPSDHTVVMSNHEPFTTAKMKVAVAVCYEAVPPRGNDKSALTVQSGRARLPMLRQSCHQSC